LIILSLSVNVCSK